MYARSATGLSPESVVFYGCTDFTISKTNYAYMLRPEAVESFYYLYHLTGDPIYRVSNTCSDVMSNALVFLSTLHYTRNGAGRSSKLLRNTAKRSTDMVSSSHRRWFSPNGR